MPSRWRVTTFRLTLPHSRGEGTEGVEVKEAWTAVSHTAVMDGWPGALSAPCVEFMLELDGDFLAFGHH